ncbi:uncharacterized protein TNCV_551451 [Trichonephila clavipes]|nr:uncharacterized protein TNCV_551451 [Trichonephila clavipes]
MQLSPTDPWTCCDVLRPNAGLVGDDAWSAKAHEWDVCCVAPYPTVSAEQCAPILFYLVLHCIELSTEPLSGSSFASLCETVSDEFFFDSVWTSNTMSSTAGFTVIHPLCISTNNPRVVQFWKYLIRAFKPLQSALYQSRLDPQPFPSHSEISERMILQTLQQQLNTTST